MIIIALGANLPSRFGTPLETLKEAKKEISSAGLSVVKESKTWLSAPVPISDQPWFHNEVAEIETNKDPHEILDVLLSVEEKFGRVRTVRNAPRLLDLDIIDFHGQVMDDDRLILPHPRMHQRAFVVKPVMDICPDWVHPVSGETIQSLNDKLPIDQEIKSIS